MSAPERRLYESPQMDAPELRELGQQFRVDSIRCAAAAKSGHPTSGMSAADLMAVLVANHLRYDFDDPKNAANDRLVFSKGHASTLLYAIFRAAGAITDEELLQYRTFGSILEGHPTPLIPWVDVATGSLGQGLPLGVGMGLAGKYLDRLPSRVWVLCGDSEMAEGSMWEAFEHAVALRARQPHRDHRRQPARPAWRDDGRLERRRLSRSRASVRLEHDRDRRPRRRGDRRAPTRRRKPRRASRTVVIATDDQGQRRQGRREPAWLARQGARQSGRSDRGARRHTQHPGRRREATTAASAHEFPGGALELPRYDVGEEVATRKAYGDALAALGAARGDVVALDGEVGNSTFAEIFAKAHPDRYFEMYIAEQQLLAAAVGLQARGWNPFASTFSAFFSRAYDFIRMAAISRANLRLAGSHAGVSIGEDGPSQMALEDIAAMRAIHSSTVLHPSDANQTAKLVAAMADTDGIVFMRTLRPNTPVIYDADEEFEIGGSRVVRSSDEDEVTLVGAGVTLHEALRAADKLADEGIKARVIDLYSIKPIDAETLQAAAEATGRIVTVEDHFPEGGIGEAVLTALAEGDERARVVQLAVREMPHSGKPTELLSAYGIDAEHIAVAARELVTAQVTAS